MPPNDWTPTSLNSLLHRISPPADGQTRGDTGRAARAVFRRTLTGGTHYWPSALQLMFREVEGATDRQIDAAMLTAGLFSLHPVFRQPEFGHPGHSFGASLWHIRTRDGLVDEGLARRFNACLGAARADLDVHLRHLVTLLRGRSQAGVNWIQLTSDVLTWSADDHPVQRRWARDFWRRRADEAETTADDRAEPSGPSPDDEDDNNDDD